MDDKDKKPPPQPITPVAPGSHDAAAIIQLSDGRRTTGVDTLEAAKMAADRGVRIYLVGLGSVGGPEAMPEGMPIYLQLDEPTLREVARMTGGETTMRARRKRCAVSTKTSGRRYRCRHARRRSRR
ncbi:MAG: hypothetical protein PSV40_00430 [Polaromonas sp.]|uniref:hypothetical protein n=1 Tax=Polaromonas sp. TaxID=1869339 RepID=UPI002488E6A9|nr:hypothetical protein [Polaromonas sp.]MDI1267556.1 hypothetical protein [Polaromonas sp.]